MNEGLFHAITTAVLEGDEKEAQIRVIQALEQGLAPLDILQKGVLQGINRAGELWNENKYFLPDVILAAEAFKAAMVPLEPKLKAGEAGQVGESFVIGVVRGDMHNLGKGLVAAMLQASGFQVIDLGIDVPAEQFVQAIKEHKPAIVGLGAYMTTTMLQMKPIIAELRKQGVPVKLMVGGVPTSQEFANEMGADAWGRDALDATRKALALVGVSSHG